MSYLFGLFVLAMFAMPSAFFARKLVAVGLGWSRWLLILAAASPVALLMSIFPVWMIVGETYLNARHEAVERAIAATWLWVNALVFMVSFLAAGFVVCSAASGDLPEYDKPIE